MYHSDKLDLSIFSPIPIMSNIFYVFHDKIYSWNTRNVEGQFWEKDDTAELFVVLNNTTVSSGPNIVSELPLATVPTLFHM